MADLTLWLGLLMLASGAVLFLITAFMPLGGHGRPNSESTGRRVAVLLVVVGLLVASGGCMAGGGQPS